MWIGGKISQQAVYEQWATHQSRIRIRIRILVVFFLVPDSVVAGLLFQLAAQFGGQLLFFGCCNYYRPVDAGASSGASASASASAGAGAGASAGVVTVAAGLVTFVYLYFDTILIDTGAMLFVVRIPNFGRVPLVLLYVGKSYSGLSFFHRSTKCSS